MRNRRSLVVLLCVSLLAATLAFRLGTGTSRAAVSSTLHASVGPGFDISLTFDDKTPVTSLPAGTYRVVVDDESPDHNFHLAGPGVDESTPVESTASPTWTVTFRNNETYTFQCDPHADSMYGRFDVGTPTAQPASAAPAGAGGGSGPSPGAKATAVTLATLLAGVDTAGKVRLTANGFPVKSLTAGRYRIVTTDSSPRYAVALSHAGGRATPLTGAAFVGRRTVTTQLTVGVWKLAAAAKSVVFRVAAS